MSNKRKRRAIIIEGIPHIPIIPICPRCGSNKAIKTGRHYSRPKGGIVQKWRCKTCGANYTQGRPEYF